jgi:hypothetical protein
MLYIVCKEQTTILVSLSLNQGDEDKSLYALDDHVSMSNRIVSHTSLRAMNWFLVSVWPSQLLNLVRHILQDEKCNLQVI